MQLNIVFVHFVFIIVSGNGCKGDIFPLTGQALSRGEDHVGHEVKLPPYIQFPFGGSRYNSLYVSKDGLVGFHPYTLHKGENLLKYLTRVVPAFVAPLYFPAQDIGSHVAQSPYKGQVLYRYGPGTDPFHIPRRELANYSSIIEQSVVGVEHFTASFGLVVTWKDVIAKPDVMGLCNVLPGHICKNSTFQLAMLTDGYKSFAIFNYINVDIQRNPYYQAGFNIGEGRGFTKAFNSKTLYQAHNFYGSDVKGRYIYRIDTEKVVRGGCENTVLNTDILEISPKYAGMNGGKMLEISGPCMFAEHRRTYIACRFGGSSNNFISYGFRVNKMKAKCSVPMMAIRGWIKMELSINGGPYMYHTQILIVHPGRVPGAEMLSLPYYGRSSGWNETTSQTLTVKWDGAQLTNTANAVVNIVLIGYGESPNRIIWRKLADIGTTLARANTFTFSTDSISCNGGICNDYEIGFVMVDLQNRTQATQHKFLVSKVITLGFFVNKSMTAQLGPNWPSQKCKAWYNKDKQDMRWLERLEYCPCNLVQALSDFGRWQTDVGCDLYDGSKCTYHIGALHCVRSVQPSSDGAGNQCCYGSTGNLRFAADSFQGSTPDRSHTWGAAPYSRFGMVPSLSHWIRDVVTFYYCCLWTGYQDCDYYMDQRATRDCVGYNPPTPAMVYGQGHIQTFDGKLHRMCAEGDFILMNSTTSDGDVFTVQGRFFPNVFRRFVGDRGNSTVVLTNIAVRVANETVEIRLRLPSTNRSRRTLDVLVNQQYYFFEEKQSYWQDFNSFAVVNTDTRNMESNFTIILHNGLGIQVADCNMTLCLLVMAPPSLMGRVQGLLGNFNGNSSDDLLAVDPKINTQVAQGQTLTSLQEYQLMQHRWAVPVMDTSIMPMNVYPDPNDAMCSINLQQRHLTSCHDNRECLFDYSATGSSDIALYTLYMAERLAELHSFVTPVRSCGLLNVPRSFKSSYNYTLGSSVTIQGCRTGSRQGSTFTYTCRATNNTSQAWSPAVTTTCSAVTQGTTVKVNVNEIVGK